MGITWVTDVISWVHVTLYGDQGHAIWIVPDLINAFHGVFIFIVVGCQPQVSSISNYQPVTHALFARDRPNKCKKYKKNYAYSLKCRF